MFRCTLSVATQYWKCLETPPFEHKQPQEKSCSWLFSLYLDIISSRRTQWRIRMTKRSRSFRWMVEDPNWWRWLRILRNTKWAGGGDVKNTTYWCIEARIRKITSSKLGIFRWQKTKKRWKVEPGMVTKMIVRTKLNRSMEWLEMDEHFDYHM